MNESQLEIVKKVEYLYDFEKVKYANLIKKESNPIFLHYVAMNITWEDLTIAKILLDNKNTDVGTVLRMIELASGGEYALEGQYFMESEYLKEYLEFCELAMDRIKKGYYLNQKIHYAPYLTKVQLFKIKKYNKDLYEKNKILFDEFGDLVLKDMFF